MLKSKFVILITTTLVLFSCNKVQKEEQEDYVITAQLTSEKIQIDGVLDESAWQTGQEIFLKENRSGKIVSDMAFQTRVKTCFDEEKLYISFICNDPDIWGTFTNRDDHLWLEEAIEVFIDRDAEPNTYVEIEVSPHNVLFDSYIVDPVNIDIPATKAFNLQGIETAVSVNGTLDNRDDLDHSWTVEIAIPFKALLTDSGKIVPDETEWRINFYRIDQDPNKPSNYAWSPTGARFHKPSAFGILRFASNL